MKRSRQNTGNEPRPVAPLTRAERGLKRRHWMESMHAGSRSAHPSGARIETSSAVREVIKWAGRSAHPSGARIETSFDAQSSTLSRVAPLTRAERGLKQGVAGPLAPDERRSAHPSGARIETCNSRRRCRRRESRSAHPSGARIETVVWSCMTQELPVAPLTRAERGLKLVGTALDLARNRVAPLTRAERGLKLLVVDVYADRFQSLRSPERSAD